MAYFRNKNDTQKFFDTQNKNNANFWQLNKGKIFYRKNLIFPGSICFNSHNSNFAIFNI